MTNKSKVDVCVYLQTQDGSTAVKDVVDAISRQAGIVKADVNQKINKLLDIEYDPELTSGNVILDFVRSKGISSYLVGM